MKRLTLRDVAELAGVSMGTASNVINKPELVGEETRARVLRAMRDIGFVRNNAARQLRRGRNQAIGLVVLDIDNPFFTSLARGFEEAVAEILRRGRPPTALFCTNDLLAIGAEHAALTRGLRVPEDLAIVGYDDIRYAAMSFVPLTSVRMPAYELGYQATQLLIDEATNGPRHRHQRLLFEPELVIRQSTAPGPGRSAAPAAEVVSSDSRPAGRPS